MPRPIRPWFRFYVEALSDRKLRRLTPAQRWLWVAILGAARQSPIPGYLLVSERDAMETADLADLAGMPTREVEKALPLFDRAGLIERDDDLGAWLVPKFNARQFESDDATKRTRKHRSENVPTAMKERSNTVPGTAVGTPPETETETETEERPSGRSPAGHLAGGSLDPYAPAAEQPPPQKPPLTSANTPPAPRCAEHADLPADAPIPACHRCRDLRQAAARAALEAEHRADQQRRAAADAIRQCGQCDNRGQRPDGDQLVPCDHRPPPRPAADQRGDELDQLRAEANLVSCDQCPAEVGQTCTDPDGAELARRVPAHHSRIRKARASPVPP